MKLQRSSKRLTIRPLRKGDYSAWKRAQELMLPAQSLFDSSPKPENKRKQDDFLKILKTHRSMFFNSPLHSFAVFLNKDKSLIGFVGMNHIIRRHHQSAFIGYWIFNNHWGHGYATEATDLCIKLAFEELKLHRVEAEIQPANKPSIRVVKKLGFWKEGLSKKRLFMKGKWRDYLIYALTCEKRGYRLAVT